MENFIKLWASRWRSITMAYWQYVRLKTRQLIILSELNTKDERIYLSISLVVSAVAAHISYLVFGGQKFDVAIISATRLSAAALAVSLFLYGPFFVAYRAIGRRQNNFLFNVLVAQLPFVLIALLISGLPALANDARRVDFKLFDEGIGEQTAKYDRFCGGLDRSAQFMVLNMKVDQRIRSVIRDTKTVISWGEPTTAKAILHRDEIQAQFERRKVEIAGALEDSEHVAWLARVENHVKARYAEKYWSTVWSDRILAIFLVAVFLITNIHIVRGSVDRNSSWKQRWIAAFALLIAWIFCGSSALAIGYALEPAKFVAEDIYSEFFGEKRFSSDLEEIRHYESELKELDEETSDQRNRLRLQAFLLRKECPKFDNRSLW
jgi:hypothetical protein